MDKISRKLNELVNNEKTGFVGFNNYRLRNIKSLANEFGNPHKNFKSVHIAGTNGKGSTAHMLNSILIKTGYRTGLYTSPHLLRITENIRIDNREIPRKRLIYYIDDILDLLKKNNNIRPTYFDVLTLSAFRYFSDEKTDIAVVEAGLGGKNDSTNIISPVISIITDISLDHIHVLGNTLGEITEQKAGIIKRKSIAITSNRNKEVLDIIEKKAEEKSSDIYAVGKDIKIKNYHIDERTGIQSYDLVLPEKIFPGGKTNNSEHSRVIKDIQINAPGKFQVINSSLAVAASLLLNESGFAIDETAVVQGLIDIKIRGRLEILCRNPFIVFDPAHNPAALKTLIRTIKLKFPGKNYYAVTAFMKDKAYDEMLNLVYREFTDRILYFELDDIRAFKISEERSGKYIYSRGAIEVFDNINNLNVKLKSINVPDALFLFTGSFRLYKIAVNIAKKCKTGQF